MAYLNELGHARGAASMVRKSRLTGPTTRYANGPRPSESHPLDADAPTPGTGGAGTGAMSLKWSLRITSTEG